MILDVVDMDMGVDVYMNFTRAEHVMEQDVIRACQ